LEYDAIAIPGKWTTEKQLSFRVL